VKDPDSRPGDEAVFREEQRFLQPWLWVLILVAAGFAWFAFVYELFRSLSPDEEGGQMWITVLVWVLVGLGLPALFFFCRLVVEVRSDGLYYRYYPFHRRKHRIAWDEIKTAEARTYSPIKEYGGWGIRGAWKKGVGKAYNVYGNRGLQLELVDGRRILFGSQEADELASAVKKAIDARSIH
jgi:hypothetical protein